MIGKIIKWGIRIVVILIIFAILPKTFLDKLKPYLNLGNLWNMIKTGFNNLVQFIKETFGFDLKQFPIKLKEKLNYSFNEILGIKFGSLWSTAKNFLANIFEKLAIFFK